MAWPTTKTPRTEFVTVRLTKSEVTELDRYAQKNNCNRSTAVRRALLQVVKGANTKSRNPTEQGGLHE